jgi:NAD(P)-dependent dehydrogenase (short-subunit alcohol dehydrogenase family)
MDILRYFGHDNVMVSHADPGRYIVSAVGNILYATATAMIQLSPNQSKRRYQHRLNSLSEYCGLFFGRLLPRLVVSSADLTGKVAIVTGANSGIGFSLAQSLTGYGATVYLACRNASKAEAARKEILALHPSAASPPRVHVLDLDTSDLASTRACATAFRSKTNKSIDFLIHNAGVSGVVYSSQSSESDSPGDGLEIVYKTNVLSSFLLTYLLEDRLSLKARVIFTTSHAQHYGAFASDFPLQSTPGVVESGFHTPVGRSGKTRPNKRRLIPEAYYVNTKSMQCAMAKLFQLHFNKQQNNAKVAHAFSPGFTRTPIFSKFDDGQLATKGKTASSGNNLGTPSWFQALCTWYADNKAKSQHVGSGFRSLVWTEAIVATEVSQGAATGLQLCTSEDSEITSGDAVNNDTIGRLPTGRYWDRMHTSTSGADMLDEARLRRLWKRWENDAGIEWSLDG